MSFCKKCGAQIAPNAPFCSACGTQSAEPQQQAYQQQGYQQQGYQQQGYQQQGYSGGSDVANNKMMGILAYLGILVLIPVFAAKESPFARFHANQGLVLALAEVAYAIVISIFSVILYTVSWRLATIMNTLFGILWLAFLVLSIIGLINASSGKTEPLPVIGGITILK